MNQLITFPILLFSSMVWGEKKRHSTYEVKKAQGSLLVNEFSEFQIFLSWRDLENHFRKEVMGFLQKKLLCVHVRLSTFCRLPGILAQPLMEKIKT